MKKGSQSSYVKKFKEKFESKDSKQKTTETTQGKGINFDNLKDWEDIVNESETNNQSINHNELRVVDIYNPSNKQEHYLKANLIHEDDAELSPKGFNQYEGFNDYSVNTSNFTYKQNDFGNCDKIDLSTVNGENSNMIIGKRVPIVFCENMVSQIKKGSPEQYRISQGVIKEEDDEYKNYSKMTNDNINENNDEDNEKDSLDMSDKITNQIDDSCNITQNQMNELDNEMNKMLNEIKVKVYAEKKIGNATKSNNQKEKEKETKLKSKEVKTKKKSQEKIEPANEALTKNNNQAIVQGNSLQSGQVTGKFGGMAVNTNANVINNPTPITYPYQGYPLTYIQQCQPMEPMAIQPQMYQDINGNPIQCVPIQQLNHPYQFYQIPMNTNVNYSPVQPENININAYNQNTFKPIANQQAAQTSQTQITIAECGDQSSSSKISKNKVTSQYRPKTMKEYKKKYSDAPGKKMGGLGANIGTKEWEEKQQKINKIKQYSSKIKETNKEKQAASPVQNYNLKTNMQLLPKKLTNKGEEELKNELLHDSLSEDENDMNTLHGLLGKDSGNNSVDNDSHKYGMNRPIQSAKNPVLSTNQSSKGGNSHVNFIKNLKKDNEQKQPKDSNINLSNYKQVSVQPQTNLNAKGNPKHNKIYTTMKQPAPQPELRRNKSLDPCRRQINNSRPRSLSKPKITTTTKAVVHDDELTEKFMQTPMNNLIENLLQNHQSYNNKVDKIKMYLHNN